MNVCILTEGSSRIGIGHIMRCSCLYSELLERRHNADMYIYDGRGIERYLSDISHKIVNWQECDLSLFKNKTCIIDSYLVSDKRLSEISNTADKCIYIDDNNERSYPKGIVVNPSLHGNELQYSVKEGITYLLGKDYIILRKPFRQKPDKQVNTEIKELTVTIGGTDVSGITYKIFNILKYYKHIKKNIILDGTNRFFKEISAESDGTVRLLHNLNADEMKRVFLQSDMVISAAGQTCHELVQLSVPSILIKAADNQHNNIRAMTANGFAIEITEAEIESGLNEKIELMNYDTRKRMTDSMSGYDFSGGVSNIIDEVEK